MIKISGLAAGAYWHVEPGKAPVICEKRAGEDFLRFTNGMRLSRCRQSDRLMGPLNTLPADGFPVIEGQRWITQGGHEVTVQRLPADSDLNPDAYVHLSDGFIVSRRTGQGMPPGPSDLVRLVAEASEVIDARAGARA